MLSMLGPAPHRLQVLVVEDHALDRLLIAEAFQASGVEADLRVVPTAEEALVLLDAAKRGSGGPLPDVLLLDLHLPGMSGVDLLVELRQDPLTAAVAVVAMSGSTVAVEELTAQGLRVKGFMPKPLSPRNVRQLFASLDLVLWV